MYKASSCEKFKASSLHYAAKRHHRDKQRRPSRISRGLLGFVYKTTYRFNHQVNKLKDINDEKWWEKVLVICKYLCVRFVF